MANILDRYGIKEVCDITFYTINEDGSAGAPVLYLDTAKTSTLEQTAETTYAQGGKGNPRLIGWDFGKEITITLEDALFSPKSMALTYGDTDNTIDGHTGTQYTVKKTLMFTASTTSTSAAAAGCPTQWTTINGVTKNLSNVKYYDESGVEVTSTGTFQKGKKYYYTFEVQPDHRMEIEIGPNTFPGTYYVTMDTFARSEATGQDEYFQIIVPKAKITSEQTLTMEADGDPTVFNLNFDVLRASTNGESVMMKMVQYGFDGGNTGNGQISVDWGN